MTERFPIRSSRLRLTHAVRLVCAGSAVALLAACGGVDFASAGDSGIDGGVGRDAPGRMDAPHAGGDAGRDSAAKDANAKDGAGSNDTGTPDTGTPDTGTPGDSSMATDGGSVHDGGRVDAGHDAGHDAGGPACSMGPCNDVSECTMYPATSCKTPECTGGCCTYLNKIAETTCLYNGLEGVCTDAGACVQCDVDNDCSAVPGAPSCSPAHTCVECNTTSDCRAAATCMQVACSASGTCVTTDSMMGSPCMGPTEPGVCTGTGTCVACLSGSDCTPTLCRGATCVSDTCIYANDPTGTACGPTGQGYVCNVSGDCCSGSGGPCLANPGGDGTPP